MLLAPAAAQQKEKSGSRTAVPTPEVNTLHVESHKRGQPQYLQQQVLAFTVGKEGFHRDGFLNLSTSVVVWLVLQAAALCLDLAPSSIKPRP